MTETEFPCVQHLPRKLVCESWSVDLVTQNGMADVVQMDANLMRAPAVQRTFHNTLATTGVEDAV